ncbi:MAG: DUF262 domain-containing protein [Alcaligenaceae bacterium]|nr:DUF262 domain-containing protein [Alcaligenaceae bacterium]
MQTAYSVFDGRRFFVPDYQRDYAWTLRDIDQFLSDIEGVLYYEDRHCLGYLITAQMGHDDPTYILDGQQEIITLTMLFANLVGELEDDSLRHVQYATFIKHPLRGRRLQLSSNNHLFFVELPDNKNPTPTSAGQNRLKDAYLHIRLKVQSIKEEGG